MRRSNEQLARGLDAGRVVGILTEIDVLRHICGRFRNPKLGIVVSYP